MAEIDIPSINLAIQNLLAQQRSLILSTQDQQHQVQTSYTPFARDVDGAWLIFVSRLAAHTHFLLNSDTVSAMLIEDEAAAANIFSRKRLVVSAKVQHCERHSEAAEARLNRLQQRLGHTVALLRGLGDFELFRLVPLNGQYVQGFGQAFEVRGPSCQVEQHIDKDVLQSRRT